MKRLPALLLCLCLLLSGCAAGEEGYVPTGDGLSYGEDYTGPQVTVEVPQEEQKLTLAYYPNVTFNPYNVPILPTGRCFLCCTRAYLRWTGITWWSRSSASALP